MDFVGSFADFVANRLLCKHRVAPTDGVDQRPKIPGAFLRSLRRTIRMSESHRAPAPDSTVEHAKHGGESCAFGSFKQGLVERILCFEHFVGVGRFVCGLESGECLFKARNLVIIGVFDKKASGQSFQNGADGVKIAGFFYGESANNRTLVGDDRD